MGGEGYAIFHGIECIYVIGTDEIRLIPKNPDDIRKLNCHFDDRNFYFHYSDSVDKNQVAYIKKLFPYEGRIRHIFAVKGPDAAFFNSGVWIKAAPRFEVGMSLKECIGIFVETELAHRTPQKLSPLDQLIQYIARPVYERVPGNDNVKTFDRIRITVGLPRYQFNSWEALQNEVKKSQYEIYQRVIQRLETDRPFKRYGVPINFLEISNVTLLRDFSLEFIFELKEPKIN